MDPSLQLSMVESVREGLGDSPIAIRSKSSRDAFILIGKYS